ncbi:MAG TPA: radical SAM protein [Patescibacteria group bacterium]|nr:radical SAM protein [Patescibacteria group bacterium]
MVKTLMNVFRNLLYCMIHREGACTALCPLYHITPFCNLSCAYCDGFPELGLPRDKAAAGVRADAYSFQLATNDVKRLLGILRGSFDFLFVTGGEPLVRDDIEEILDFAGSLRFNGISINTNSVLLPEKERILGHISNLVISLDMLDTGRYGDIMGCGKATAEQITRNVVRYKELEKRYGYRLTVHTVILPGGVDTAEEVLEFCLERDIAVCLSPLQMDYAAHASLRDDVRYVNLIDRLMALKRRGAKISGSYGYYRNIRDFDPYRCIPTLIPRILPDGTILYPCRPAGARGGNILDFGSWEKTLEDAVRSNGRFERCDRSCRIRCYIEPSILMNDPVSFVREFLGQI